jgi:hypothetical protein
VLGLRWEYIFIYIYIYIYIYIIYTNLGLKCIIWNKNPLSEAITIKGGVDRSLGNFSNGYAVSHSPLPSQSSHKLIFYLLFYFSSYVSLHLLALEASIC